MDRPASSPASPPAYQPQMDGLRAVAVVMVLLHHFDGPFYKDFNFGPIGVRFFLVASGFWITRILLKCRQKCDQQQTRWAHEMGQFQLRRLVRTVPIYYLSIFIAAAFALPPVRESLFWTLTFLTNFYMASLGYFPDTISHFWSLAVQEQFYLIWPFLIFFLPRPWIKYSFAVMIVVALAFRLWCIESGASEIVRWFSLPGSLDTFSAGGILAYASIKNPGLIVQRRTRLWSGVLAAGSMLLANQLRELPLAHWAGIFVEPLEAVSMGWLVACSVAGFRGWFGRVLSCRPMVYLGRISYGIYVYHVLVSILMLPLFRKFGQAGLETFAVTLRFTVQTCVTFVTAGLSWHFIEQPLLKLREHLAQRNTLAALPVDPCTTLARR